MRQLIIILILFLGVIGGGYFILNPDDVYDNAAAVEMTEIVLDDGESTLMKRLPKDVMNETIDIEGLLPEVEATSTETEEEKDSSDSQEEVIEEAEPEEVELDRNRTLVLANGRTSDSPEVGTIFACDEFVTEQDTPKLPWIQGNLWYPELKIKVEGDVFRKNTNFVLERNGATRTIAGNGLPSHGTGVYPIQTESRIYPYAAGNYTIRTQILGITLPSNPKVAEEPSCLPSGRIGIMISGSPLYSALMEGGLDAGARALEDDCGGHPNETGEYHYHRESMCVVSLAEEDIKATSTLIGYALDGFGIYASLENKEYITNDDLDECHGHTHLIEWDGNESDMYHYHMTDEFPYSLGCFRGTSIPN